MSVREFGRNAVGLARNPLGVVALFLFLVYGIAALLVGTRGAAIGADERWALTLFLVVFPFLVLIAFYDLVTRHHTKLYAPSDYRDERLFIRSLSPDEMERRTRLEIAELQRATSPSNGNGSELERGDFDRPVSNQPGREVDYRDAKDLALRRLGEELGVRFEAHIALRSRRGDLDFDGIAEKGDLLFTADVKYLPTARARLSGVLQPIWPRLYDAFQFVRECAPGKKLRPYVALVYGELVETERRQIEQRLREQDLFGNVEQRVYSLAELRDIYFLTRVATRSEPPREFAESPR